MHPSPNVGRASLLQAREGLRPSGPVDYLSDDLLGNRRTYNTCARRSPKLASVISFTPVAARAFCGGGRAVCQPYRPIELLLPYVTGGFMLVAERRERKRPTRAAGDETDGFGVEGDTTFWGAGTTMGCQTL